MIHPENEECFALAALTVLAGDRLLHADGETVSRVVAVNPGGTVFCEESNHGQRVMQQWFAMSDVVAMIEAGSFTLFDDDAWAERCNAKLVDTMLETIEAFKKRHPVVYYPHAQWTFAP